MVENLVAGGNFAYAGNHVEDENGGCWSSGCERGKFGSRVTPACLRVVKRARDSF